VIGRRPLLRAAVRRPRRALLAALLLVSIAIWGASNLRPRSTRSERIMISFQGNLATTLDPTNLKVLVALERRIGSLPGVQTVAGPGTFIEQSVNQTDRLIRQKLSAAHPSGPAAARRQLSDLLVRYGYEGIPSLDNTSFVGQLIFGSGTQPKQRFAWLFPDGDHALVLVRPRAGLSNARMQALGNQIERLVTTAPLQGVSQRSTSPRT
jgi:hypothetical protein